MQPADGSAVLGNFDDASFTYNGIVSTFFKRDGKFMVRTDGPDGNLQDYEIAYTFGVYPLQQYLIGFPDGRYQALGIAWDSRSKEQGGQRWFHLYPDQNLTHQRPAALDRLAAELELHVRRVPFHESAQELRSQAQPLQHHLVRDQCVLRSLPRPRRRSSRLGQEGRGLAKAESYERDWPLLSTSGVACAFKLRALAMKGLDLATPLNLEPQARAVDGGNPATSSAPPARRPPSTANRNCAPAVTRGAGNSGKITSLANRCWTPTAGAADA
jgi:hypothetical protein